MSLARLGIVDWGIGGIGLLQRLDAARPDLPISYWSDTGFAPYGLVRSSVLRARLEAIVHRLAQRGCTEVVLACNAASTVVDRLSTPIPVRGIIASGISAVPRDALGVVGVVAGARTVRSGAYRRGLAAPGRTVRSRVAQPLSAHIEAGRIGTPAFVADLHEIVRPLRGASAVVLACTHYPAAADAFAAELPDSALIDPARHLADELIAALPRATAPGEREIATTGDRTAMRDAAAAAWGFDLGTPAAAHLP